MTRMTGWAVLAAVFSTLALAGCGGDSSATPTDSGGGTGGSTGGSGGSTATIEGVTTPSTVSVVTAKNADN